MSLGEFAGKTASEIVFHTNGYPKITKIINRKQSQTEGLQVLELLEGIDSGIEYPKIVQSPTKIPIKEEYDVVVVGGGTSGAIAAISAARYGARVAVVEILPNLGGIGSNRIGLYYWGAPWKSFLRQKIGENIHLTKNKGHLERVLFSMEDKKRVLHDMAINSGVHIYYQSLGTGAIVDGNKLKGIVVENFCGRHAILSDIIIDATGHAGIAIAAGAKYAKGRSTDEFLHEIEHGPLRNPTHLGDISKSYMSFPSWAISLNIRESRQIIGDYMISFEDVINERLFSDVVCRWYSHYDTHFPNSANQSDLAQNWTAILGLWRRPIIGSIPYRSLIPKGLDNILVVGTAYSADHDALKAARMQPEMEHLGEAAGVAAAMASRLGLSPRNIPIEELQKELVQLGVLRCEDVPHLSFTKCPTFEELHHQDLWKTEREKVLSLLKHDLTLEENILFLGTDEALNSMVHLYLAGDSAIPFLRPLLGSENQRKHEEAAVLLGILGDRASIPAHLDFIRERNTRRFEFSLPLSSGRPSVPLYWTSVILLGRFGVKDAVPLLIEILNSPPSPEELRELTRPSTHTDMFEHIESCPPSLASFIIVALGRIGDPKAVEVVRPFLTVSNPIDDIARENRDFEISWGVQTNAAWSLAQMGDLSGVPVLIELLNADQERLRNYSQILLEGITGKQFGRCGQSWKEWWQSNL